jgi:hypothetical protein
MERITIKHLSHVVALLNDAAGAAREPYTRDEQGQFRANVGTFTIDRAYGGFRLERIATEGGGASDISPRGTAREVYTFINGMLEGIERARDVMRKADILLGDAYHAAAMGQASKSEGLILDAQQVLRGREVAA